jgi:hypothetical protein
VGGKSELSPVGTAEAPTLLPKPGNKDGAPEQDDTVEWTSKLTTLACQEDKFGERHQLKARSGRLMARR